MLCKQSAKLAWPDHSCASTCVLQCRCACTFAAVLWLSHADFGRPLHALVDNKCSLPFATMALRIVEEAAMHVALCLQQVRQNLTHCIALLIAFRIALYIILSQQSCLGATTSTRIVLLGRPPACMHSVNGRLAWLKMAAQLLK